MKVAKDGLTGVHSYAKGRAGWLESCVRYVDAGALGTNRTSCAES